MDQPRHPHTEATGWQKNACGQYRPDFKANGERDSAKGFQPWPLIGNARRRDNRAKKSGPVALALNIAKRGRAGASTPNTSAFSGAADLIGYQTGPDKLGRIIFFKVKVTAHDVSQRRGQKNWVCPIRCILLDAKPSPAKANNPSARQSPNDAYK